MRRQLDADERVSIGLFVTKKQHSEARYSITLVDAGEERGRDREAEGLAAMRLMINSNMMLRRDSCARAAAAHAVTPLRRVTTLRRSHLVGSRQAVAHSKHNTISTTTRTSVRNLAKCAL